MSFCFVLFCLGLSITWHDRKSTARTEYPVGFWCIGRFCHCIGGIHPLCILSVSIIVKKQVLNVVNVKLVHSVNNLHVDFGSFHVNSTRNLGSPL